MKILLLLLPCIIQIALSQPDYATPTSGDWATNSGCTTATSPNIESPIQFSNYKCKSYTSFDLQMTDTDGTAASLTAAAGAYTIPYTGSNQATLTYNGVTYTSTQIAIRTASEHILYGRSAASDAELQIEMSSTSGDLAVVSFLVKNLGATSATSSNNLYQEFSSPYYNVLKDYDTTNVVNLADLATLIKTRVAADGFLNFYTYQGTMTYGTCSSATWFIYAQELYMSSTVYTELTGFSALVSNPGTSPNLNNRQTTGTGGGSGLQMADRLCFAGYFEVNMSDNYGLWFGVVSILIFFILTLTMGDNPIKDPDYHEDVWTHHPWISIKKIGNELHTRKSRTALFLCMITVHALFASVFYRKASDPSKSSNTILFAVYATLINMPITYFLGNFLRRYYLAKHQYHKTHDEAWEQKAQNRLFAYYILVFATVVVGWSFTVWNCGFLLGDDQTPSKLWVASFFIGIGLDLFIVYPIGCILAKGSHFFRRIIKSVGFMYDNICHETYMDYIKQD